MKKWLTFALVASSFGGYLFAQTIEEPTVEPQEQIIIETKSDPNEVYVEEPPIVFPSIDIEEEFIEFEEPYNQEPKVANLSKLENGRILDELNDVDGTDAYPFLSKNGLRLYWTQSDGGDHLVVASRSNTNEDFSSPQRLEITGDEGPKMSCWLSADELTIYYVSYEDGRKLMKASRSKVDAAFASPQEMKIVRNAEYVGFFSAPSLTQDENQLFLYSSTDEQRILQFERNGADEFVEVGVLDLEGRGEAEPGQLSNDGLSFNMTIEGQSELLIFQRTNIDQPFEQKEVIDLGGDFHQITYNDELMVLGFSPDNNWGTNDLYIAQHPLHQEEEVVEEIEEPVVNKEEVSLPNQFVATLEIFPNPAESYANLQFELPESSKNVQIDILDLQGKLIRTEQVNQIGQQNIQLDVQDLPSGTYICRLAAEGVKAISKPLVIR